MGVFKKFFFILHFLVRSTSVPNFIKMQNTRCKFFKKFAHLAWNDPIWKTRKLWVLSKNMQDARHDSIWSFTNQKKMYVICVPVLTVHQKKPGVVNKNKIIKILRWRKSMRGHINVLWKNKEKQTIQLLLLLIFRNRSFHVQSPKKKGNSKPYLCKI